MSAPRREGSSRPASTRGGATTLQRRALWIVVTLTVLLLLAFGLFHLARSRTLQLFGRLVSRVETSERVVALSVDDGPNGAVLDEVLERLAARDVRATFFVNGAELARHPDAGRRLVAAGHELGNHTYSHARMVLHSQSFIRHEIEATDDLIRAAGQRAPIRFRAPFCWKLVGLPWFLWRTGRTSVTWDVEPDSYPALAGSAERIAAHVVEHARPGSIVLLHVWGNRPSRAALPAVIDGLRARGYRLVTVGELLRLAAVARCGQPGAGRERAAADHAGLARAG